MAGSIGTLVDTTQTSALTQAFPLSKTRGEPGMELFCKSASNGGALDNKYVLGQGFLFEVGDEIQIYRETNGISAKIYGGGNRRQQWGTLSRPLLYSRM